MSTLIRFGRKVPLPSTAEIKHDLKLMESADAIVATLGDAPMTPQLEADLAHVIGDLAAKHGLSRESAAQDLLESKELREGGNVREHGDPPAAGA
jgi:hypothetical protein